MTDRPLLLRQIFADARPYVEQLVDLNTVFTGFRKLATENGLDWGQIKSLLRAEIEDERGEDGSKRVDRIVAKAEWASEYALLLGLGTSNMNECNSISVAPRTLPPHDEDGVIIEDAPAPGAEGWSLNEGANETAGPVHDAVSSNSDIGIPISTQPAAPSPAAIEPVSAVPTSVPGSLPDLPAFLNRRDPECAVRAA